MALATAPAPVGVQPQVGVAPAYPMASLYVGDLHPDVNEAMLFEKFSVAGPVMSIRVCRDAITRRSLGYAYVNFQQPADAERALDTMNFDQVMNKAIRIMWSQRDPALRRSGVGNIFIKNLDKTIDNKAIHDTFSMFGSILSCKVALDENGASRGYGFVHFETEESALQAIEKVNGMLLNGKKVFVGRFLPRVARFDGEVKKFMNVYAKNLSDDIDDEKLNKLFAKFGEILSCVVAKDPKTGKSRGFGFVSFKTPEEAEQACTAMNGTELEGSDASRKLFVGRAQKKVERQAELRRLHENVKSERQQRFQGANLYVKNIDERIDEDQLSTAFNKFGPLSSVKVMRDEENRSKGFGFVCFTDPEHATKAVTEMNGTMLKGKPLYVALAQRKEDRKAHLAAQYMQRLAAARMNPSSQPGQMYTPAVGGHFVAQSTAAYPQTTIGYNPQMMAQMRTQTPQWGQMQNVQMHAPAYIQQRAVPTTYTALQGMIQQQHQPQQQQYYARTQQTPPVYQSRQLQSNNNNMPPTPVSLHAPRSYTSNYQRIINNSNAQRNNIVANTQQQQPTDALHLLSGQGVEPLTTAKLASMESQAQKQTLGERIFPCVSKICPVEASKVTGMLLEMDNAELLMMLDDETLLNAKVNEALAVYRGVMKGGDK